MSAQRPPSSQPGAPLRARLLARLVLPLLVAGTAACSTVSGQVIAPARSTRGRMGFGVTSATQAQFGATLTSFRTTLAGASAPSVEPGGGDWVWRIATSGTKLELCHAGWATRSCRVALFDGGANTIAPFLEVSVVPILVDPVNLGRVNLVSTDHQGNTWSFGRAIYDPVHDSVPVTPGYGVWALGAGGLHHCQLEGQTPQCRVAKMVGKGLLLGEPLSIKTYVDRGATREGVWFGLGSTLAHCEVQSGVAEAPTCRSARVDGDTGEILVTQTMASHLIQDDGVPSHIVWLQSTTGSIYRCAARGDGEPACKVATRE